MKFITFIFLLLQIGVLNAQKKPAKKEKFPSYFGLQVRTLFPTNFIGTPVNTFTNNEFSTTISQKMGFSFGGTVRAGLTKLIAFESGINFTQRNFDLTMAIADSNVSGENNFSFICYDVPINALVYIQLSEQFYMNASLGFALTFKPTSVGVLTLPGGSHSFTHSGFAFKKFGVDLNANFGFEYRTEKSGFFYLGGSARVPFAPVFDLIAQYKYQGYKNTIYGEIDGSYLSLDLKYFFPNIKTKGPQFIPGPIE
jgi:hypothetical protein